MTDHEPPSTTPDEPSPQPTKKSRVPRRGLTGCLLIVLALLAMSWLGATLSPPASVAYVRASDGDFEVAAGSAPGGWTLQLGFARNESSHNRTSNSNGDPALPLRMRSFTIVDQSATALTRRIAHRLAEDLMADEDVLAVDVRIVGESLDLTRLGDQILVLEELESERAPLSVSRRAHVVAWLGHIPEFGWADDPELRQSIFFSWSIEANEQSIGLPGYGLRSMANAIASSIDLPGALTDMRGEGDSTAPFPPEAAPEYPLRIESTVDLGDAISVARAMGVEGPPLLSGRRGVRKGEAHWRCEGPDAVDRLDAALEALCANGWTRDDAIGSRGSGGRTHMAVIRRGDQVVRFTYEENRTGRLQQESWTSTNGGPQVHHVEGPALDPVVWIHYRNEPSASELRALLAEAEREGVRDAWVANLSRVDRETLGLQ